MVAKTVTVIIKTSRVMTLTKQNLRSQSGFTLIEIMIVLAILGAIIGLGLPRLKINNNNIKSIVRELSVLTKEVRNGARLKGKTFRLAFKLDPKKPMYWVESAAGPAFAPSEETLKNTKSSDDKDAAAKSPFQKDESILKKEKTLPKPLIFGLIDNGRLEPFKEGMAYIYFSPEGLVENAAIQITDGKDLTWTLIINPLTGHADIMEKAVLIKDVVRGD